PAPQHMELLSGSRMLGHDEVVLQQARAIAGLRREDNMGSWRTGEGVYFVWQLGAFYRAMETGDFADVAAQPCIYSCSLSTAALRRAGAEVRLHDVRLASAAMAEGQAAGGARDADLAEIRYRIHATLGDWASAASDAGQMAAAFTEEKEFAERFRATYANTHAMPLLAYAQARRGEFAKAWATIGATPADCYDCIRARGQIDALHGNWIGAQYWFDRAVKQAPSIPFADADWGQMLMARGDLDGAIAKFDAAHRKGPHFADPLELWGEALIAKNRSDLALARFEDASRYAPSWGRLHLKWGEALLWSGHRDEARKQFAVAATLGLTPSDRDLLTRLRALHG